LLFADYYLKDISTLDLSPLKLFFERQFAKAFSMGGNVGRRQHSSSNLLIENAQRAAKFQLCSKKIRKKKTKTKTCRLNFDHFLVQRVLGPCPHLTQLWPTEQLP
jgi:hypothetical protein